MKRIFSGLFCLIFAAAAAAATTTPVQLLSPTGSTVGQAIISNGPSSAPSWGTAGLASIAGNSVVANATGSSAAPAALAVPSCSTSNSALKWVTNTGFTCGTTFALTSGNLSQFASTTSAQMSGLLSDETGTGAAVFAGSPTFTGTAAFAAVTATGTITPSQTAGIVGTTTNNNANAGSVGEYVTNNASGVSLTSSTSANLTSISLTAGDWDVQAIGQFVPAGGTTVATENISVSTTSNTLGATLGSLQSLNITHAAGQGDVLTSPVVRVSIASTTTVYAVANSNFSGSTLTANGFISARRVR